MVAVRSQAMMLRIILCITLCWTLANAYSSTYIIVSPNAVRPGLPLNVSVTILKAPAPVDVTCTLVKDNVDITSQTGTFQAGKPGTLLIQVPTSSTSGSYSLRVVGSGGLRFRNESQLAYKSKGMSIFVQTDKAIYKPGQTVRLRALAVYPDLKTFNGPMTVEIYDSLKNKIKRWVNLQEPSGVVAADLPLSEQPPLGNWKIKVTVAGQTEEKQFSVDEYVLPKFEVTVNLPSFMLTTDKQLKGSVSAKYTYGKAVEGTGVVKLKLDYYSYRYKGPREIVKHLTLVDGKADFTEDVAVLENMYHYGLSYRKVIVEAQVTETLTGITLNGTAETKFHTTPYKIEIPSSTPKSFKPGLRYTGFAKVSLQDGRPIVGARPKLQIDARVQYPEVIPDGVTTTTPRYYWGVYPRYTYKSEPTQVLEVPDDGFVHFNMDVPKRASEVSFTVKYGTITRYHSVDAFKSPSDSFLQVLLKTPSPQAGSNAEFEVKSTEQVKEVVYQILARGNIVSTKRVTVDAAKPLQVTITPEMAPKSKMVIYYVRSDGEVVADSLNFNVKGAFKNQVSLQFDKTKAEPGQKVSVSLSADPGSFVGLLAVDQSVLLLKSGNDITQEEVLGELDTYDTRKESFYGWGGRPVIGRKKRSIWWYPIPIGGTDAHDMFQNTGVVVLSDTMLYQHKEPMIWRYPYRPPYPRYRPRGPSNGSDGRGRGPAGPAGPAGPRPPMTPSTPKENPKDLAEVEKIRKVFPESWLWNNVTVG
ncbi:CD109 antigen-like isoform X1 [Lingula anatina]|uniref:CD109 antigen-like isoform X1 n=2 Tax=Lingula anatina TaxID=7574 RepID=A0A1S3H9E3_LINAN|nr:CD109 antigen-like isoform X1 [Lingula anatina]|eukprot:XP_013382628.1 CD109 antigen-like isoform X1 [Lingula anatina]